MVIYLKVDFPDKKSSLKLFHQEYYVCTYSAIMHNSLVRVLQCSLSPKVHGEKFQNIVEYDVAVLKMTQIN